MATVTEKPVWSELLRDAISKPGTIHAAYTAFRGYSLRNQILALIQCSARGIQPGPIACFNAWKDKGRHVKKGEKAIELCMPLSRKVKETAEDGTERDGVATFYAFRKNWFVLSQTDGEPLPPVEIPAWSKERALTVLNVTEGTFQAINGNVQGYARAREIAISPLAALPFKTTFHELGHVILGHTAEGDVADGEHTPRNLREVEAECVALICCESLGLEGAEYARGYIQNWLAGGEIPERSAARILTAADEILKAGSEGGVQ